MLGFIFKLVIFIAIVTGIVFFVGPKLKKNINPSGFSLTSLTNVSSISGVLKNIDMAGLTRGLSQSLDSLVTHDNQSPVVLGVHIADTSLDTVVNLIRNLPPSEYNQIKSFVCQPATASAK